MANYNAGGNRQKSRKQHELAGTFRKDRHADLRTPEPSSGEPTMPADLSDIGRVEWARMVWAFQDMGTLCQVDAMALEQYCELYAETKDIGRQRAEAEASIAVLEQNIRDVEGPDLVQLFGQIVLLRKLVAKATDQLRQGRMALRQYLVEFGLTPASRGRLKLPSRQAPTDDFTAYQLARVK